MFADLGSRHAFTYSTPSKEATNEVISYKPMSQAFDRTNWSLSHEKTADGGSPFGGYKRMIKARQFAPQLAVPILGELTSYGELTDSIVGVREAARLPPSWRR